MIVAVAALLFAAGLSAGLRATSGWLDHWHPLDRLAMAIVIGLLLIAAGLAISTGSGLPQAGYGLAFSLAPVGLYDVTKWWFRSRRRMSPWLVGADAAAWVVVMRWVSVMAFFVVVSWVLLSPSPAQPPQ